jgi:hypothetical protein
VIVRQEYSYFKNAIELHYADCERTRFIPRGHTQITSTATDAILNWRRCRYPDAARIVGSDAISNTELILRKIDQRWPQA